MDFYVLVKNHILSKKTKSIL